MALVSLDRAQAGSEDPGALHVNPEHVVYVTQDGSNDSISLVATVAETFVVAGAPSDVVDALQAVEGILFAMLAQKGASASTVYVNTAQVIAVVDGESEFQSRAVTEVASFELYYSVEEALALIAPEEPE